MDRTADHRLLLDGAGDHGEVRMNRADTLAKAIVGGVISGLTALGAALGQTANKTFAEVTAEGWVAVALAFVATFAGVYFIPNAPREPSQAPIWVGNEDDDEVLYQWQQPVSSENTLRPEVR